PHHYLHSFPTRRSSDLVHFIFLDDDSAEQQYLQAPAAGLSAEKLFEQQWAATLLEQVLAQLREEFIAAGKGTLFEALKVFLTGRSEEHTSELQSPCNLV